MGEKEHTPRLWRYRGRDHGGGCGNKTVNDDGQSRFGGPEEKTGHGGNLESADTGEGTFVSISLWETHAQAEAAAPVAATWVRENMADRIELRSNQVGDLAFFEGVPTTV